MQVLFISQYVDLRKMYRTGGLLPNLKVRLLQSCEQDATIQPVDRSLASVTTTVLRYELVVGSQKAASYLKHVFDTLSALQEIYTDSIAAGFHLRGCNCCGT